MSWRHPLHQSIENMWWSNKQPSIFLRGLSHLYHHISSSQLEKRKNQSIQPALPMISVGNITVGGSGKTPFVIWLSKLLAENGYQPVVLCRGDGGGSKKPRIIDHHMLAKDVGDEAVLLHQQCPCPVITGSDRIAGSALAKGLGNIIILDDGFQYRHLQRVLDIVLIPDTGIGNGCLIPAGPLREPVSSLQRADLIIRTGHNTAQALTSQKEWYWHTIESELIDITGTSESAPPQVFAVTGIARPQRFLNSLKVLSINIQQHRFFPDHHPFSNQDVLKLVGSNLPIAVTAKDAVKLRPLWPDNTPLWVLHQNAQAEQGLDDSIIRHLQIFLARTIHESV